MLRPWLVRLNELMASSGHDRDQVLGDESPLFRLKACDRAKMDGEQTV